MKGSASDYIAQTQVESAAGVDWPRNAAFAAFSGLYLGVGQHLIYNRAFTVLFGSGQDLRTGLKKVLADSLVHVPLIYLPLYYPFKSVVLGEGSFLDGLARYRADAHDVLTTYWSIWPALHLVNFTLTPPELRISLVAAVSFGFGSFICRGARTPMRRCLAVRSTPQLRCIPGPSRCEIGLVK